MNHHAQPSSSRFRHLAFVAALVLAVATFPDSLAEADPSEASAIPPQNRADLSAPLPRPSASSAETRARALFEAIANDDPKRAEGVFFPRYAFLQIKAMADPGRYYDRLFRRFESDIHALHESMPELDHATFERFDLATRGGFVRVGEEGNRLPYWASRHSWLHYRVGTAVRKFEVRVLITWGNDWYVIHLSEF